MSDDVCMRWIDHRCGVIIEALETSAYEVKEKTGGLS